MTVAVVFLTKCAIFLIEAKSLIYAVWTAHRLSKT